MNLQDFKDPESVVRRFRAHIEWRDGCLTWTGYTQCERNSNHGVMSVTFKDGRHKPVKAHRVAWVIEHGEISDDLHGCHRCDNPRCVYVVCLVPGCLHRKDSTGCTSHIFLGTQRENNQDMREKGRGVNPPRLAGVLNSHAKLTDDVVIEILQRLRAGESGAALARAYGVQPTEISALRHGRIRKEITAPLAVPVSPLKRIVGCKRIRRAGVELTLECGHGFVVRRCPSRYLQQQRAKCPICAPV